MTTELLLDKGLELFGRKGYAATTVDDIAASAGATRTTFYLHFASKARLMMELIERVDGMLTAVDDPSLEEVVAIGCPDVVRTWINHKFDQWNDVRPYLLAAYQAAPTEPGVAAAVERWFEDTTASMEAGLERADRFDPGTRRIRCVLAFGQFEYLARRVFRNGWLVDRDTCLDALTDSWCHLLAERGLSEDTASPETSTATPAEAPAEAPAETPAEAPAEARRR